MRPRTLVLSNSQYSFHRPSQGFVEITIKDLENMLHTEVSRLWSKGVINVFTDSRAVYDPVTNSLTKFGENLKVDDLLVRRVNEDGNRCSEKHSWKVAELVYTRSLGIDDLKVGEEYGVYIRFEQAVLPFKLVGVDLDKKVSEGDQACAASPTVIWYILSVFLTLGALSSADLHVPISIRRDR
jgi:hypothetical protein